MAKEKDEDALLLDMLKIAQELECTDDALMKGQYAFLRARIEALLQLREAAAS